MIEILEGLVDVFKRVHLELSWVLVDVEQLILGPELDGPAIEPKAVCREMISEVLTFEGL
ncbi:hypothetical protein [Corynebacterium sp. SA-MJD20WY100]|uniref:hypothetical protein n=1 Tax=Corynebacterium sp. SA-MJD20WY100 TaxID=3142969 RepID=UPI003221D288